MSAQVHCQNCGAVMSPGPDGRLFFCQFCRTSQQVGIGGDQIAAGMAVDFANIDAFLSRLATTLRQGFAEHSQITMNGEWIMAIDLMLEPDRFHVHREGQQAVATHQKVVRGIALRTKTLALDVWFDQLTRALAEHANTNARAAWVLGQLGGQR
jgi:hypothetical protein